MKCETCKEMVSFICPDPNWCPNMEITGMHNIKPEYNTPRSKLLMEVMEIVHKDRNANYGNPENNFQQIADLWNAYWTARNMNAGKTVKSLPQLAFNSHDVAIMNMMIKIARLAKNPQHHDSVVDIAGYAACLADVQESAKADGSASA